MGTGVKLKLQRHPGNGVENEMKQKGKVVRGT